MKNTVYISSVKVDLKKKLWRVKSCTKVVTDNENVPELQCETIFLLIGR